MRNLLTPNGCSDMRARPHWPLLVMRMGKSDRQTDRQTGLGEEGRGGLRETKQQRCQIRIAGVAGFAIKTPDAIAPLTHPPTDSPAANPPLTGVDPGLREAGNCRAERQKLWMSQ